MVIEHAANLSPDHRQTSASPGFSGHTRSVGVVDRAVVGLYDVGEKVYHRKEFTEPMELTSLLGTVTEKDGKPYLHLHATFCDANMLSHGGHVNELHISATCEMILRLLPGEVGRRQDEVTGLNLFEFNGTE